MDSNRDGGPAFPVEKVVQLGGGGFHTHRDGGMTLRDYLAAKALSSAWSLEWERAAQNMGDIELFRVARTAYAMADAMLKERAK